MADYSAYPYNISPGRGHRSRSLFIRKVSHAYKRIRLRVSEKGADADYDGMGNRRDLRSQETQLTYQQCYARLLSSTYNIVGKYPIDLIWSTGVLDLDDDMSRMTGRAQQGQSKIQDAGCWMEDAGPTEINDFVDTYSTVHVHKYVCTQTGTTGRCVGLNAQDLPR